jgi:hypothetical protein
MADELPSEASGHARVGAPADISTAVEGSNGLKDSEIRERAYLIWVNEGRPHGRELDHWLRAEWELEQER